MAKYCPVEQRKVLYLECLECNDKKCRKEIMGKDKNAVEKKSQR